MIQLLLLLQTIHCILGEHDDPWPPNMETLPVGNPLSFNISNAILDFEVSGRSDLSIAIGDGENTVWITWVSHVPRWELSSTLFPDCDHGSAAVSAPPGNTSHSIWRISYLDEEILRFTLGYMTVLEIPVRKCFLYRSWDIRNINVSFPEEKARVRVVWSKNFLGRFTNTSDITGFYYRPPEVFTAEILATKTSNTWKPIRFAITLGLGLNDRRAVIVFCLNGTHLITTFRETELKRNWVIITENNKTSQNECLRLNHIKWRLYVTKVREGKGQELRVSSNCLPEDRQTQLLSVIVDFTAVSSIQTYTNDKDMFWRLIPSTCEGVTVVDLEYPGTRWQALDYVLSSPQTSSGLASSVIDSFTAGFPNPNYGVSCSVQASPSKFLELKFKPVTSNCQLTVVIYPPSSDIRCSHYVDGHLEGTRVFVDNSEIKLINREDARKSVISMKHMYENDPTKRFITVRIESKGESHQIEICEVELYVKFEKFFTPFQTRTYHIPSYYDVLKDDILESNILDAIQIHELAPVYIGVDVYIDQTTDLSRSCYEGNQKNFFEFYDRVGIDSETRYGASCAEADGNAKCRGPDVRDRVKDWPWCYTDQRRGIWDYCAVSQCTCTTACYTEVKDIPKRGYSRYVNGISKWDLGFGGPLTHDVNLTVTLIKYAEAEFKSMHYEGKAKVKVSERSDFMVIFERFHVTTEPFFCYIGKKVLPLENGQSINIYMCPHGEAAYVKVHFNEFLCMFSRRCPGDEPKLQACGCPFIEFDEIAGSFKTVICKPSQNFISRHEGQLLNYIAVRSEQMDDGIADCDDDSDESANLETKMSSPRKKREGAKEKQSPKFRCYDGTEIDQDKRCNLLPDCKNSYTFSQLGDQFFLYEDELGCGHRYGKTCFHSNSGTRQEVWVPARYYCDGFAVCDDGFDELDPCLSDSSSRLTCTANGTVVRVYEAQRCDPAYTYCDGREDKLDCKEDMLIPNLPQLQCNVKGRQTLLMYGHECDGVQTCDNGEDEVCLQLDKACRLQHRIPDIGSRDNIRNVLIWYPRCQRPATGPSINQTMRILEVTMKSRVRCPLSSDNTKYSIPITALCDNRHDCPGVSEEVHCPSYIPQPEVEDRQNLIAPGCTRNSTTCTRITHQVGQGLEYTVLANPGVTYDCNRTERLTSMVLGCVGMCQAGTTGKCLLQANHRCRANPKEDTVYSPSRENNRSDRVVRLFRNQTSGGMSFRFRCHSDDMCIEEEQLCDNIKDCVDGSDEQGCGMAFHCDSTDDLVIPRNLVCNGHYDCLNKADECGGQCESQLERHNSLLATWEAVISGVIGLSSILINTYVVSLIVSRVRRAETIVSLTNDMLVSVIAVGDWLVGLYMMTLFVFNLVTRHEWCQTRLTWKVTIPCQVIGVLSAFGNNLSLLSMTCLAAFRAYILKYCLVPPPRTRGNTIKIVVLMLGIGIWCFLISIVPALPYTQQFFANGLVFESNPLFPQSYYNSKEDIDKIVSLWGSDHKIIHQSWIDIHGIINEIFFNQSSSHLVGFYGSDDICLFKYFTRISNPQSGIVIAVLLQNIICFCIITISYTIIWKHSSETMHVTHGQQAQSTQSSLHRKITLIIITDFLTWAPIAVMALLYMTNTIDDYDLSIIYPISSIVLLPINSVVNPIIYSCPSNISLMRIQWMRKLIPKKVIYSQEIQTESTKTCVGVKQIQNTQC